MPPVLSLKGRSDLHSPQKGVTRIPGSGERFRAAKRDLMDVHFSRSELDPLAPEGNEP